MSDSRRTQVMMARELSSASTCGSGNEPVFGQRALLEAVPRFREAVTVVQDRQTRQVGISFADQPGPVAEDLELLAWLPAIYPEWLGDRSFCEAHQLRFPYVGGAMANGISSTTMVRELAGAGFLAFFGAAGLEPAQVEAAVAELREALDPDHLDPHQSAWGSNLIHSPHEPDLEAAIAELYVRRGVRRVSASAYMKLTPAVVHYAYHGLGRDPDGTITRSNHVFAKVSRPEVAKDFLQPAPAALVQALVDQGKLSQAEAELGSRLPVAEDVTAEADSGGHTDNQSLTALLPTMLSLRDRIMAEQAYQRPIRIGAAGGLGTPSAVAAAFALGAAYVLTGSVNQACCESGMSEAGRQLLAEAGLNDVVMAPAADMFELGVEVQVLRRGTMFSIRARRLYELFRSHQSLAELPAAERNRLERDLFHCSLDDAWQQTRAYWQARDPRQVVKAEQQPRHQMALLFRSYLGQASRWALTGEPERRYDYQIWCGQAMGAFNAWTAGSFLADPGQRGVVQVARNLMEGAAAISRAQQLRCCGVPVPATAFDFRPRRLG